MPSDAGSGDQQIVRASSSTGAPDVCEESGMGARHLEVVGLDRQRVQYRLHECMARRSPPPVRQLNTDEELGRRYGRYDDIVLVVYDLSDRCAPTFCGHEDGRIEDQPFQ